MTIYNVKLANVYKSINDDFHLSTICFKTKIRMTPINLIKALGALHNDKFIQKDQILKSIELRSSRL